MPRLQFQTLTEPMYYILLALADECCGVDIMKRVAELSHGRVSVGPGTLYTLLAKFEESGIIMGTNLYGRKRAYIISPVGKNLLRKEYTRLHVMADDGKDIMEGLK